MYTYTACHVSLTVTYSYWGRAGQRSRALKWPAISDRCCKVSWSTARPATLCAGTCGPAPGAAWGTDNWSYSTPRFPWSTPSRQLFRTDSRRTEEGSVRTKEIQKRSWNFSLNSSTDSSRQIYSSSLQKNVGKCFHRSPSNAFCSQITSATGGYGSLMSPTFPQTLHYFPKRRGGWSWKVSGWVRLSAHKWTQTIPLHFVL